MSSVHPDLCEDLRNFLMTFVYITAESVRATQGQRGIMIMSVDMGSRLWKELEKVFSECAIQDLKLRFVVTPEITDLPPEEIVDFPLEIDLNITTLYSDYNLPVEITLPEGHQLAPCAGCV
jgi:hypothetical protein